MTIVQGKTVIVGVGLVGASLGLAARRRGLLGEIVGVGRSSRNLQQALEVGAVTSVSSDLRTALSDARLVMLATPVDTALDLLDAVAAVVPPECVVTDVGSVKEPICRKASSSALARRFVGAHPMAGGVATGASAADPALFDGKVVVVTPATESEASAVAVVEALWNRVGGRVLAMDAAVHDAAVARTSHLPHMLAFALAATAAEHGDRRAVRQLVGPGFQSATRLAASDVAMWTAIAKLNRTQVVAAMDAFSARWHALREAIDRGDEQRLGELLRTARANKRTLDS